MESYTDMIRAKAPEGSRIRLDSVESDGLSDGTFDEVRVDAVVYTPESVQMATLTISQFD